MRQDSFIRLCAHATGFIHLTCGFIRNRHTLWTGLGHSWHDLFICNMTPPFIHSFNMQDSFVRVDMTCAFVTWLFYSWKDSVISKRAHSFVTCIVDMTCSSAICRFQLRHNSISERTHSLETTHLQHASYALSTWTRPFQNFDSSSLSLFHSPQHFFIEPWRIH